MFSTKMRAISIAAATLVAMSSATALAQDAATAGQLKELSDKIEQMRANYEKQLDDLRRQQKQLEMQQAATRGPAPAAPAAGSQAVVAGDLPGSIKIPGTNTSFKIGGYAHLDIIKDLDGGAFGAIAVPPLIPFGGSVQDSRTGALSINARRSRLYMRTLTPTRLGPAITHFEGDFYGAGGNETISNSSGLRLRHAYAELGPWLAGQTWTNFNDIASLPETVDFAGGEGSVNGVRAGQLRYTAKWGKNHQLSLSAENPEADIFGTVGTTMSAGVGPTSTTTLDKAPDVNVRYVYSGGWGRASLSGMVRRLTLDNRGQSPINGFVGQSSVTTKAWAAMGRIKTFGADSIQYSFAQGDGVGRYILGAVSNTSAAINNGRLEGIEQKAWSLGYQHVWSPTWRSNVVYGRVKSDFPRPGIPLTSPNRVQALFVNVLWSPVPNGLVGLEWQRGEVRNAIVPTAVLSNKGKNNRLMMMFRYGF